MVSEPQTKSVMPVVDARLGRLLGAVFLLFALLVVNSVYLITITALEFTSGEVYQDYYYLLMFLVHLVLGLLLTVPVILFVLAHIHRAWRRPNRYAIRAGIALFTTAMLLLVSGLLLTRFDFFEINDPLVRRIGYWVHIVSPIAAAWLFVLHRLAGPPIHWRSALRWSLIAAAFAVLMVMVDVLAVRQQEQTQATIRLEPSLAQLASSDFIPSAHLMTDEFCADCHADIARSHEHSMHRFSSFNNPAYRFSVEETRAVVLKRDGSVKASRFCAGCHDPVPLFSGRFDSASFDSEYDPTASAGITCMSCHAMTQVNSVRGNADYTLIDPPRYPFAFSGSGFLKSVNQQLIKAKPAFHKKTFLKPFHKTAEFCSTCHKTHIPAEVNHYRWLRGQNHYDSFLQSGVSGHRVDSFYYPDKAKTGCSDCHMPLEASDGPSARRFETGGPRSIHNHQFAAANTGIAYLMDLPGEVMEAQQARLREAARIDIFGIKEQGRISGKLHAPLRPGLPVLEPGKQYLLEIVVRTTGMGHHLTQGTSDSNELWIEVIASAGDRIIGRSGELEADGTVDPWSYFVNAYVLDREGNRIDRRNAQDIFVALYNHQIPPGAASVVHYLLDVPSNVRGPVKIEARLNYRKFDTTFMRYLQGDEFTANTLPIVTMAEDEVHLPVGYRQVTLPEQESPVAEAERWNDYGIGLLLEGGASAKGELRQAEEAFKQVEALGDAHGTLNLARIYFREGRLEEAARTLRSAGGSDLAEFRWVMAWYSALIDRENGYLDEAIETLESLADTRFAAARERGFDFSYDVNLLNALGRTLFERSRQARSDQHAVHRSEMLAESRDWFRKTLDIDPENLTAHYNLALVFADLGDEQSAATHRALHEAYRPDDHAIEQAVTRSRSKNPAADHAAEAIAIYELKR